MQKYTNAQILAAVLEHFLQPIAANMLGAKLKSVPWMQMAENKVKSWGIAPPNWSMAGEIASFLEPAAIRMVSPIVEQQLSGIPDSAIPLMAHSIVDKAIANGKQDIIGGYYEFEESDLKELKRLLDLNMPLAAQGERYVVRTDGTDSGSAPMETVTEETEEKQSINKKEKL